MATSKQTKPYSEMTEEEAKSWFKYCFKRTMTFDNISESYVCDIADQSQYGNGYGVIRFTPNPDDPDEIYDPEGKFDIDELKQYMEDYPEMVVEGWIAPLTEEEQFLTAIRTEWVYLTDDQLKSRLYSSQTLTFLNDDIWEGNVTVEESDESVSTLSVTPRALSAVSVDEDTGDASSIEAGYLIQWKGNHYTCDGASTLISQYSGDDDEKAEELKILRNNAKAYIRQMVDKFLEEHANSPEAPTFETRYVQ